jgi:hypothetical protein
MTGTTRGPTHTVRGRKEHQWSHDGICAVCALRREWPGAKYGCTGVMLSHSSQSRQIRKAKAV